MSALPGVIGGAAAAYGAYALTSNVGTTAVVAVAGCLVADFMCRATKRALMGTSAGFWQTNVGRYLIGRLAGTAVYTALVAALCYIRRPTRWRIARSGPIYLIGWKAVMAMAPAIPWLNWGLPAIGAWYLRTPAKVLIGKSSAPLRRYYRRLRMGNGGSAGFAGICEEWANRWRPGMIFFGHSLADRHWPVGIRDERMLCTLGGNGSGKGESAIINNVLLHDGSMFVNDPSGQIAAVTAEALRRKGYEVHIIDHMNVLGQGTSRLDPVAELDPNALNYVSQLKQLVDAMAISSGSGRN